MKIRQRKSANVASVSYATSPLLASRTPPGRSKLLVAAVCAGFCVLLGRAAYIQLVGTDFYQRQGEIRYSRTLELPASRGRVVDRNGLVLATSVPAPSIWVIPKDFDADRSQRRALAKLLDMPVEELDTRVGDDNGKFAWLRRQVEEDTADAVRKLGLKGVHELREYKRKYPEGESAAHVVGFTNIEEHGQEGIELAFDSQLAGRPGSRSVIRDRLGRIVEDTGTSLPPVDGRDIGLTLDSKVQFFAYQRIRDAVAEHRAKAGSVVVLDAKSGEVLALANYPSYNPGDRRKMSGEQLRNRALTDTFEPGSTMKPLVIAQALESGRVTPTTVIPASALGQLTITGATIRDAHRPNHALTVQEVIQKSSNVGTVTMAMQMQPREMWEMFSAVGIGQRPQLDFPGAVTGRLRPYKSWKPIEQATMSYGYGLSVSLFQLARAYTVFANDGELIPSALVMKGRPPAVQSPLDMAVAPGVSLLPQAHAAELPAARGTRVFSPKTAQAVREMLHMVTIEGGTAPKAQALGYSVGGKTGTAYKQEGRGYAERKYRSWFVGLAPVNNPRVVVAVMVDEPSAGKYFGGDVAAPVFSQVVQQSLRMMGVPPDQDVKSQITAREIKAEEESF